MEWKPVCRILTSCLLLLAVTSLTACGRRPTSGGGGVQQSVLRYPLDAEPSSLDPVTITDITTLELLQNIYEGLVRLDEKSEVVPCLAEKWDISPDGKVYTFHLRRGARFHNGRVVAADDVKYSFERALWPETKSPVAKNYLDGIVGVDDVASGKVRELSGVKVQDPQTLVITLKRPRGYFLGELAYNTAWVYCKEAIEKTGKRIEQASAIGTGPFKLADYRRNAKVTLDAFGDYWGGKPKLDRIERPIVKDPQVAHLKYENGEVDAAVVAFSDFVADQQNPKLKAEAHQVPLADVQYLAMGQLSPSPFQDKKVRLAFAMAIDRDAIARIAYKGLSTRANSLLCPGVPGYDPNFKPIPYDPAGAQKLLTEAGFPGGKGFPHLNLVFVEKDLQLSASAAVIRDNLKQNLGISIDLEERESATFFADARAKKLTFHLNGWVADYPDPQNFLPTLLHTGAAVNRVVYHNPEFDRLCDEADTSSDPQKRIALYRQADQLAMSEAPLLPIVYNNRPVLIKPYVHDFKSNLMNFLPHRETYIQR